MNTKIIIGGVIAAVVSFLAGWLLFGILLMPYYNSHMYSYTGLMKEPPIIWGIGLANLAWGLMLAYIFNMGSVNSISKGVVAGFIIFLLIELGVDLFMYSTMNLYPRRIFAVDVAANGLMGAISGAVLGWWFSRK